MSMNNQTLQQLLADRVSVFAESDRPREMIDAGIEKLFQEVVSEAFRSYGDFGKAVKEAVTKALPANVSDMFQLSRYNALVSEALRQRWHAAAVESTLMASANKAIDEVLSQEYITGEVSLRKLFESFIEENKESAAENQWEHPEIRFEDGTIGSSPYLHIFFDGKPESAYKSERSSYSRDKRISYELAHALHIAIDGEREEGLDHWRRVVRYGHVYAARLDDKKVAVDMQIRNNWERILASLYFGNATLVIDCDPDDFSYGLYD